MSWKSRFGCFWLIVLTSFLAACASQQQIVMPDRFETETLEDGSKRFSFNLDFNRSRDDESSQQEGQPQEAPTNRAGGAPRRVPSRAEMDEILEVYFQNYPYCEDGYFVYDQGFDGNSYTMLGECQESATP